MVADFDLEGDILDDLRVGVGFFGAYFAHAALINLRGAFGLWITVGWEVLDRAVQGDFLGGAIVHPVGAGQSD